MAEVSAEEITFETFGPYDYPVTRKDEEAADDFHGESIADPYRWLEDPDSDETKAWVREQNRVSRGYLDESPFREELRAKLEERYNYVKRGCVFRKGERFFFYKNDGLQNQYVLYKQDSLDGEATVLLDPNTLREDGTAALGSSAFSEDGSHFAYGVKYGGSDWQTVHVRVVESGELLEDKLSWVKFSGLSWTHDGLGFFYSRYPAPKSLEEGDKSEGTEVDALANQKLYYHRLGTSQDEDELIYAPEDGKWMVGGSVTHDGNYLFVTISKDCDPVNAVYYADLRRDRSGGAGWKLVKLIDSFDAGYDYITNEDRTFFLRTNLDAPKYRVLTITLPPTGDAAEDDSAALAALPREELIAETEHVLLGASCCGGKLVLNYLRDVKEEMDLFALDGSPLGSVPLPSLGLVLGPYGRKRDDEFYYKFTSFLYPGSIYRYSISTGECTQIYSTVVPGFDADDFEATQEFVASKDGTRVPVFIVRRKLAAAGEDAAAERSAAPTFLYAYGGFNISMTPYFNPFNIALLANLNATYALACIRGGGEYGDEWHKAGALLQKQNCFDDFCAVASHLIDSGVTTKEQLVINGGSNGGLLVSACVLQRPDLFAGGIAQVPVTDMLKFHRYTIGYAWCSDYGNADEDEELFRYMLTYSPLHNVRATGTPLPAVLVTTADHDDRVVPLHSFKFVATLQAAFGGEDYQKQPLICRIDVDAGHGAGKPTSKIIDEKVDMFSFFARVTSAGWTA